MELRQQIAEALPGLREALRSGEVWTVANAGGGGSTTNAQDRWILRITDSFQTLALPYAN
jgi:hypothetical protein